MHILFLTDNFPPEVNASASRVFERACYWVKWGHQVTIITSNPNFPDGKIMEGYHNKWYQQELMEGITVIRVKTFIAKNEGLFWRTLDFLSYMFSAFWCGLWQKKPDVIIATSPQFFAAVGAFALAKIKRKPFVFELGDLWPASIKAVNAMQNGRVLAALEAIELYLYRHSTHIVALTPAFKEDLMDRNIAEEKISVIINGVDLARYSPRPKMDTLLTTHNLQNRFIVGYLGTHGMAHGLDNAVHCAALLKNDPSIHFLFVGSGAEKNKLIAQAKQQQLHNICFLPSQPKSSMPSFWSLCDIALIHLKNQPVFSTVIPSKIFEAMGMGLPIILVSPQGEASKIIEETHAGVWVLPQRPDLLQGAILQLQNNLGYRQQLAANSYQARERFTREEQAQKLLEVCRLVVS